MIKINIFLTNEEKMIHKTYIKIFFDNENIFFNRIYEEIQTLKKYIIRFK